MLVIMDVKSPYTIPLTSMLVIMDVKSPYTNIDHEEGAVACYKKTRNTPK